MHLFLLVNEYWFVGGDPKQILAQQQKLSKMDLVLIKHLCINDFTGTDDKFINYLIF